MGKVVDGIAQPLLPRKRIHMEAEEEEEQTHGRLELPRLLQSFGQEVLTKALKARVDRAVTPDADIGAGLRQGTVTRSTHRSPMRMNEVAVALRNS